MRHARPRTADRYARRAEPRQRRLRRRPLRAVSQRSRQRRRRVAEPVRLRCRWLSSRFRRPAIAANGNRQGRRCAGDETRPNQVRRLRRSPRERPRSRAPRRGSRRTWWPAWVSRPPRASGTSTSRCSRRGARSSTSRSRLARSASRTSSAGRSCGPPSEQRSMSHYYTEIEGQAYRVDPGRINLGLAVDVERKDGSRFLVVPVIKGADEMDFADLPRSIRGAGREGAHQQAVAGRLRRRDGHPDQPRHARDHRQRAAPHAQPGDDRRHRRHPQRRRRSAHDDHLDLRPSHHPGRRVRRLPAPHRRDAVRRRRLLLGSVRRARRQGRRRDDRRADALAGRVGRRAGDHPDRGRAVRAAQGGGRRDGAGEGVPVLRPQGRPARPARLGARRRPGPRPRPAGPDAGEHAHASRPS